MEDNNKCVLQVLSDANPAWRREVPVQDNFIRVHMRNDGVSVYYSRKKFNRSSQSRQSRKRRTQRNNDQHNLNRITNMDEISPCKTPKLDDVDTVTRHANKFDTRKCENDNVTFQNKNNFNDGDSKSNAWRKYRNKNRVRRCRQTTTNTSPSNHHNSRASCGSSNNDRRGAYNNNRNYRNYKQNIPLRNEVNLETEDGEKQVSGCFTKLLDCLCACVCGLF